MAKWPESPRLIGTRILRLDGLLLKPPGRPSIRRTFALKARCLRSCSIARTPTPRSSRSTRRPPRRCPASRR